MVTDTSETEKKNKQTQFIKGEYKASEVPAYRVREHNNKTSQAMKKKRERKEEKKRKYHSTMYDMDIYLWIAMEMNHAKVWNETTTTMIIMDVMSRSSLLSGFTLEHYYYYQYTEFVLVFESNLSRGSDFSSLFP